MPRVHAVLWATTAMNLRRGVARSRGYRAVSTETRGVEGRTWRLDHQTDPRAWWEGKHIGSHDFASAWRCKSQSTLTSHACSFSTRLYTLSRKGEVLLLLHLWLIPPRVQSCGPDEASCVEILVRRRGKEHEYSSTAAVIACRRDNWDMPLRGTHRDIVFAHQSAHSSLAR